MTVAPQPGDRLAGGRYRLTRPLDAAAGPGGSAHGTSARAWAGRDEVLGRDVAIREVVPSPRLPPDRRSVARRRSVADARAAARISHPAAVDVYDVVEDGGRPWVVTEPIPARSLADVLAEHGPLPVARVARIGLDLLAALQAAHAAGVVHRDVRPEHVMLTDTGAVLTDFGVATPGDETAWPPAGDLVSLGATLHAAAGDRATGPLRLLVARLLDDRPDARPDAGTVRTLLELAAATPLPATAAPPPGRRLPPQRGATFAPETDTHQAALVTTAVTAIAGLAGVVAVVVQARGPF